MRFSRAHCFAEIARRETHPGRDGGKRGGTTGRFLGCVCFLSGCVHNFWFDVFLSRLSSWENSVCSVMTTPVECTYPHLAAHTNTRPVHTTRGDGGIPPPFSRSCPLRLTVLQLRSRIAENNWQTVMVTSARTGAGVFLGARLLRSSERARTTPASAPSSCKGCARNRPASRAQAGGGLSWSHGRTRRQKRYRHSRRAGHAG